MSSRRGAHLVGEQPRARREATAERVGVRRVAVEPAVELLEDGGSLPLLGGSGGRVEGSAAGIWGGEGAKPRIRSVSYENL